MEPKELWSRFLESGDPNIYLEYCSARAASAPRD